MHPQKSLSRWTINFQVMMQCGMRQFWYRALLRDNIRSRSSCKGVTDVPKNSLEPPPELQRSGATARTLQQQIRSLDLKPSKAELEKQLDDALKQTFPASDPVTMSVCQPRSFLIAPLIVRPR